MERKEKTTDKSFEVTESFDISGDGIGDMTPIVNDYVISVLKQNGYDVCDENDEFGHCLADSYFDSEWFDMAIRLSGKDALSCNACILENGAGEKKWHVDASIYMTDNDEGIHGSYDFDHEPTTEELYELLVKDNNVMDFDELEKLILERYIHDYRVSKSKK